MDRLTDRDTARSLFEHAPSCLSWIHDRRVPKSLTPLTIVGVGMLLIMTLVEWSNPYVVSRSLDLALAYHDHHHHHWVVDREFLFKLDPIASGI